MCQSRKDIVTAESLVERGDLKCRQCDGLVVDIRHGLMTFKTSRDIRPVEILDMMNQTQWLFVDQGHSPDLDGSSLSEAKGEGGPGWAGGGGQDSPRPSMSSCQLLCSFGCVT